MIEASAPARAPIKPGVYRELAEALRESFGIDFLFWYPDAPPTRLTHSTASEDLVVDQQVFEQARDDLAPQLAPINDTQTWLILPVAVQGNAQVIATGLFQTADPDLLLRLARQFQKDRELQEVVEARDQERDSLVHQITADFEELAFLREMTERLALADSGLDTMELAARVLPELRKRINAEAVVMVSAGLDNAACLVGRPVLCDGRNVLDDKSCTRLVEKLRDSALLQPTVRNHCASFPELSKFTGLRSLILVPLARSKCVLGWLLALNRIHALVDGPKKSGWRLSRHEFGTNEASLLRSTASVLATHATNVALLRDKDQLLFDMVRALVNSIEAKDRYTCGHSERVALYAKHVAGAMGLKARICKRIYLAGLLHDVGKIAIRDAVLSKNGKLDDAEFAEIQQHPDKGWGILIGLQALDDILAGVLYHHERWDGKGYPDGLAGTDIPLDARILAVADAFDAMTSDRPYRQAMDQERATGILREGAGLQWDQEVVEIFLEIISEIYHIRDTYEPRQVPTRRPLPSLAWLEAAAAADAAEADGAT